VANTPIARGGFFLIGFFFFFFFFFLIIFLMQSSVTVARCGRLVLFTLAHGWRVV
jgi:hypothetical protein